MTGRNQTGEKTGDTPCERDEPWRHVLTVSGLQTASAYRCTYSGYAAAPEPQSPARSDGEHRPRGKTRVQERMERVSLLGGREDLCRSRKKLRTGGHGAASWYGRYSAGGSRSSSIRPCYGSGTGAAAAPEPEVPTGSAGCTEQEGGGLRGGVPHMGRSSDRQWLQGARRRPRASGGPKGRAAAILGPEFGKRDPPAIVTLTHSDTPT